VRSPPRRALPLATLVAALATSQLAAALVGCDRPAPAPGAAATVAAPEPEPVPSARRPTRRYYLARSASRCEVYSADPGGVSTPAATPCPPDLHIGERIRIAGMTCTREGDAAERNEPVVCPDPLTNLERKDRGERRE
jgi:hypothetical protein